MKACCLIAVLFVSLCMGPVEAKAEMSLDPVTLQSEPWLTAQESAQSAKWDAVGCKRPEGKSFTLPEGGLVACKEEFSKRLVITQTLVPTSASGEFQMAFMALDENDKAPAAEALADPMKLRAYVLSIARARRGMACAAQEGAVQRHCGRKYGCRQRQRAIAHRGHKGGRVPFRPCQREARSHLA